MRQDITADIQNRIYEAGLFRTGERVILIAKNCVLLEQFTGKSYNYRMIDLGGMKTKHLFSKVKPIAEYDYDRIIKKMLSLVSNDGDFIPAKRSDRAVQLLTHIFTDIFPKHGMYSRENQLSLALSMLQAMQENKVALCEAEVGTGKTHAYIVAAIIYKIFDDNNLSAILSTSTIALQKAIVEEYIPQISAILLEHRIIDRPITFVVRKGKSHYICQSRLRTYLTSILHNNKEEDQGLIFFLKEILTVNIMDLDDLTLTDYVKKKICVEQCQQNCDLYAICPYRQHIRKSQLGNYDFQIANHNLVLADILSQKGGRRRLLPAWGLMVIDEAHKLPDTARQMYGMDFESFELERLAASIYQTIKYCSSNRIKLYKMTDEMLQKNQLLFDELKVAEWAKSDRDELAVNLSYNSIYMLHSLSAILRSISMLFYSAEKNTLFERLISRIEQKQAKINILLDMENSICWFENIGTTARICTLPKKLDFLLYEDLWKKEWPYVLTSGTLSVSGDFRRYKSQIGMNFIQAEHVYEVSKASPFDFREHALLYLPKFMPFPDVKNKNYMDAVISQLAALIKNTYGHTLVLFTSYKMMELSFQRLSDIGIGYPLFMMGKGRLEVLAQFRESGNGILFASDTAGEGIDLPGDILSSLIVVKLPFPIPDPVFEYEKTLYADFREFFSEVIMPTMIIKLRQWIGRGIRRENDTCVFSILDSRAANRYRQNILNALPDMPVTYEIEDVGRFIREKKAEDYF